MSAIDKPWETEPDITKGYHMGVAYRIMRHGGMGHLCGYVRLPKGHPWLKAAMKKQWGPVWPKNTYRAVRKGYDAHPIANLRVHGGVTFFGRSCRGRGYWIGFDCAHCDDLVPGMSPLFVMRGSTYRTIDFAKLECFRMAKAVAKAVRHHRGGRDRRLVVPKHN